MARARKTDQEKSAGKNTEKTTPEQEATEQTKANAPEQETPEQDQGAAPEQEAPEQETPEQDQGAAPEQEAPEQEAPEQETPEQDQGAAPEQETPEQETPEQDMFAKLPNPCVYCGPSVKGVARQYTTYQGGIPDALREFIKARPEALGLIVSTGKFPAMRRRLETPGTPEANLYKTVKARL